MKSVVFVSTVTVLCIFPWLLCANGAVIIKPCFEELPPSIEFRFNDCSDSLCQVNITEGVLLEADFTALHNSKHLILDLDLRVSIFSQKYIIDEMCNYLANDVCPVEKGRNYTISHYMEIPDEADGARIQAEVVLRDSQYKRHFCFEFGFEAYT